MAVVVPPARGVTGRVDTGGGSTTRRALLQGASTLSCMFTLFYGFGVIGNGLLTFVIAAVVSVVVVVLLLLRNRGAFRNSPCTLQNLLPLPTLTPFFCIFLG